jgi:hypothetical protein
MKTILARRTAAVLAMALAAVLVPLALSAEERPAGEPPKGAESRLSLEASAWMVMNLFPDSADFYQFTLGYWPDGKDAFFLNGVTWKYGAPIGIPMTSPQFGNPAQDYPGYVRAFGLGLGYQRMLWKGLFAAAYATPFVQVFRAADGGDLGTGFQLYLQAQAGYQIDLYKGRFFVKPFLSCNWWPINTGFPPSFHEKEDRWPDYYLFEPHLNLGVRL